MCESCNLFLKLYNTFLFNYIYFCQVILIHNLNKNSRKSKQPTQSDSKLNQTQDGNKKETNPNNHAANQSTQQGSQQGNKQNQGSGSQTNKKRWKK